MGAGSYNLEVVLSEEIIQVQENAQASAETTVTMNEPVELVEVDSTVVATIAE